MIALKGVKNEIVVKCYAKVLGDNGKTTTVSFSSKWKKLDVEKALDVIKKIQVAGRKSAGVILEGDQDFDDIDERMIVDEHLLDITGLKDMEDGEDLAFNSDLVDAVMLSREYKAALMNAFFEAQTGRKNLAVKN